MSIKRRQRRAAQSHFAVLADTLARFYEFLCKSPQPSNEEVRATFKQQEHSWKQYCVKKQLNPSAYTMFNKQVSQLWNRRKVQKPDTTGK